MSYIPRVLDKEVVAFIEDAQANKNILLVEGARQVGKSFLVQHALQASSKKHFSLNLEKETRLRSLIDECREFSDFEQLLRDRIGFNADANQVLFFDEAQESRKLGQFVRFMKANATFSTPGFCVTCAKSPFHPFGY